MTTCYHNYEFEEHTDQKLTGEGIYETMHTFKDKIWNLKTHLQRLKSGAKQLNIEIPQTIEETLIELIKKNDIEESRLRLQITTDGQILITQEEIPLPKKTITAKTVEMERPKPTLKSMNRKVENKALAQAKSEGADEAILINSEGHVTEGSISNIFIVKDNKIYYPPAKDRLQGTTQKVIEQIADKMNIDHNEKVINKTDLFNADEVFLTNAVRIIMPVSKINKQNFTPDTVTNQLKSELNLQIETFKHA